MNHYPKIFGSSEKPLWGDHCIAFDKIDGSNLRYEWSRKQGWQKFGTRWRMFDRSDPEYGIAIDLFLNKYGNVVEKVMTDKFQKSESVICYAEFVGPYSFGGLHENNWLIGNKLMPEGSTNDPKDVILFDVNVHKRGIMDPGTFVKLFSHVHIPKIIYEGKLNEEFALAVRNDEYPLKEGVVCKGGHGHNLWMRKIKTHSYLKRIREVFGTGWRDHWE